MSAKSPEPPASSLPPLPAQAGAPPDPVLIGEQAAGHCGPPYPGPGQEALEWLHHFVTALELAPAVAVHATDRGGVVRFWNRACEELYGISAGAAIGVPYSQLVSFPGMQAEFDAEIDAIWRDGQAPAPRDWLVQTGAGRRRWIHACRYPVQRDGHTQQVFCMALDITARKEAEVNLERAAQVFQNARDAIVMMDAEYRVQTVNNAFTAITGYTPGEIVGRSLASLRWGKDAGFYERIWAELDGNDHWEGEMTSVRKNGQHYPARVALTTIRDAHGDVTSYMAMLTDISERKRVEEQVRHQAEHDPLTGLPNRILFLDRLHQALATSRRHGSLFAVLFVDLDRFKSINDTHGHQAGDLVLREVASRLKACVRRVDTVSRLGGDEFVMLLSDIRGPDQAAHVAGLVTQAIARPVRVGGQEVSLSASIGIAICPSDGDDVETLLHHADVAMYHAKQNGRDSFRFFSPEMNAHVIERVELENRLRQAVEAGEFLLEYQPEIEVATGRVTGLEALLRWRHPERGLLLPGAFLPVAEESGLILPIGEWVLREACRQGRAWRDAGHEVTVAVNMSNTQLVHGELVGMIDEALGEAGLAPQALELELLEDTIIRDTRDIGETVTALRSRGIAISIDHFGAGLSSLAALRRFPLSKLKLARSYVADLVHDPVDAAMLPAIIALARSLRLRVVAEGVETADQLAFLRRHGCDEYQGFYAGAASSRPDLSPHLP